MKVHLAKVKLDLIQTSGGGKGGGWEEGVVGKGRGGGEVVGKGKEGRGALGKIIHLGPQPFIYNFKLHSPLSC